MTNNDNKVVYVSAYFYEKNMTNPIILKIINAGCSIKGFCIPQFLIRTFHTSFNYKF